MPDLINSLLTLGLRVLLQVVLGFDNLLLSYWGASPHRHRAGTLSGEALCREKP